MAQDALHNEAAAHHQGEGVIEMEKKKIGFATMTKERQREISSKGGKAAHEMGVAHEFDSEEARAAGKKGGAALKKKSEEARS